MSDSTAKAPWHLWLVGVGAVLFNAIGVVDFVMTRVQGAAYQASTGMTPEQIAQHQQMPGWMTVVWAVGVFGAVIASLLLLLRRRLAWPAFALSLAAFLVSVFYTYVLTSFGAMMGPQMAIVSTVIAVLLALLCGYSRSMGRRGVLR
jgi:hypothetical protein